MALKKKDFRTGLGNLMEDSIDEIKQHTPVKEEIKNETEQKVENETQISNKLLEELHLKIKQLSDELYLWRTGKLTSENFETTLRKHKLKFNAAKNEIEEI